LQYFSVTVVIEDTECFSYNRRCSSCTLRCNLYAVEKVVHIVNKVER